MKGTNFRDDAGHLPWLEFRQGLRIGAIFITEGQVVQQVLDRVDTLLVEDSGHTRADALHVLNRRVQFEHERNSYLATPDGTAGDSRWSSRVCCGCDVREGWLHRQSRSWPFGHLRPAAYRCRFRCACISRR